MSSLRSPFSVLRFPFSVYGLRMTDDGLPATRETGSQKETS
jgi:hypothetical protein